VPVCIHTDCKAVANTLEDVFKGARCDTNGLQESDLWHKIIEIVKDAPQNQFRVAWVPGHLDEKKNQQKRELYLKNGTTSVRHILGNCGADLLADKGYEMHTSIKELIWKAQHRKDLTVIVQRMLLDLWSNFLDKEGDDEYAQAAENDEQAVQQLMVSMQLECDEEFDYDPFEEAGQNSHEHDTDQKVEDSGSQETFHVHDDSSLVDPPMLPAPPHGGIGGLLGRASEMTPPSNPYSSASLRMDGLPMEMSKMRA